MKSHVNGIWYRIHRHLLTQFLNRGEDNLRIFWNNLRIDFKPRWGSGRSAENPFRVCKISSKIYLTLWIICKYHISCKWHEYHKYIDTFYTILGVGGILWIWARGDLASGGGRGEMGEWENGESGGNLGEWWELCKREFRTRWGKCEVGWEFLLRFWNVARDLSGFQCMFIHIYQNLNENVNIMIWLHHDNEKNEMKWNEWE